MSPVLRPSTRRLAVPAVGLALALGLTACGTGFKAQTYQERTMSDSTNAAIGSLNLRDVALLPPPNGEAYPVGSSALVRMYLTNEGPEAERLLQATSDGAGSVTVVGPGGAPAQVVVPPQSSLEGHGLLLRGLTREVRPGNYVSIRVVFSRAGEKEMLVPVQTTGTPWPRREGYHPAETDSEGRPLVEEEEAHGPEGEAHGPEGKAHGPEGTPSGQEEGGSNRPELDNDGGDSASGDQQVDTGSEPVGDENAGRSGANPPPEG